MSLAPTSISSLLQRAASTLAVVALVLLPALHAPHTSHGTVARVEAAAFAADLGADAPGRCPLCVYVSQAHAAAPTAMPVALVGVDREPAHSLGQAPIVRPARFAIAAPPRAPPV